jgi:hypothetical protein
MIWLILIRTLVESVSPVAEIHLQTFCSSIPIFQQPFCIYHSATNNKIQREDKITRDEVMLQAALD